MNNAKRFVFAALLAAVLTLTGAAAELTLAWDDNSSDEAAFAVERATGADGEFAEVARVAADVTTYTDSNLEPGTLYRYRVRAGNASGWSEYSNTADATTHPPAPAAPGNPRATPPEPVVVYLPPGASVLVSSAGR